MQVFNFTLKHYAYSVMGSLIATMAGGAIYAHFTDRIYDITPNSTQQRLHSNIVMFEPGCNESSSSLMTLTHTFTALAPTKWIFRLVTAYTIPYLGFLLPTIIQKMFNESDFVENSRLSKKLVKLFSMLASIGTVIGYICCLGVAFCLDIYHSDDENAPTILQAKTPVWHWQLHGIFYMVMVLGYGIHNLSVIILLSSLNCGVLSKLHNKIFKITLTSLSTLFGLVSIYFSIEDIYKCEDNLKFYFSVFEYLFVFSELFIKLEMSRFYWDTVGTYLNGRILVF